MTVGLTHVRCVGQWYSECAIRSAQAVLGRSMQQQQPGHTEVHKVSRLSLASLGAFLDGEKAGGRWNEL